MIGKPSWRFLRPAVLVGLPVVAVAAGAALVQSQEPQTPPPVAQKPAAPAAAAPPPPPETTIRLAPPPPPPPAKPEPSTPAPPQAATVDKPTSAAEWMALPIDDLRSLAHGGDVRAMEELARRLVSGIGVPQDAQSGAGWLLRAAEAGAPGAAFNVGVMYERGFVVERDLTRAVEWYQKAADGDVAVAKQNLALLLREGKGAPRDGKKAIELLRSAARQGMSASMFSLGDIYERGDAALRDPPAALAWFAITVEFDRQVHRGSETPLARTAQLRVETLRHALTQAELERAEKLGQEEFRQIVAAVNPSKSASLPSTPGAPSTDVSATPPASPPAPPRPPPPPPADEAAGWPKAAIDQVRAVQQSLIDLQRLKGTADGIAGPMTRAAIRDFEKSAGMRETGEVSREIYVALLRALVLRDAVARSPLPPPPRVEAPAPKPPETAAEPN
jgi:TPR repeat protein